MAEQITIDIAILQGIFGDLAKLQKQFGGIVGGMAGVDNAATRAFAEMRTNVGSATSAVNALDGSFDASMRNIVSDVMAPIAKTQELNEKLRTLGTQVRTSKSVKEIITLKKEIAATQRELDGVNPSALEGKVSGAASRMRSMMGGLAAPLAGAFAVSGIAGFAREMVSAAGAQQQFGMAMNTMLGDRAKADSLIQGVKEYAQATPFSTEEIQKASTQMLGMGFASDEVVPALKKLGDVSAGLGQPIGEMAYLYSTARAQGKLMTNDLNQFANRGVPIIDELSKVLGVSTTKVKGLVEEGKVGFPELEKVLNNMTGVGSKFGGMTEAMGQTMTGRLGNLSEEWTQLTAEMGLAIEPLISSVIDGLRGAMEGVKSAFQWVLDNKETLLTVLKVAAVSVGIYTAVLLINNAGLIANNALQAVAAVRIGAMAVITNVVTAATTLWTGAQWLLNAALNANPIAKVVVVVASLVAGVLYAWNHFEGFRAFLYGFWESTKVVFEGVWEVVKTAFGGIIDMIKGVGGVLGGLWDVVTGDASEGWEKMKEGGASFAKGVAKNITAIPRAGIEAVKQAQTMGLKAGIAYAKGDAEGRAAFQADKAEEEKKKQATSGMDATAVKEPGQNLGAASLLSGKGDKGKGDGVTVGGDGKGGGRTITMDIKITNNITLPRDANMGIRELADKVTAQLFNKFNDANYAMG